MQNISITTEGIQKNLNNYKPIGALCEYIWNGFDAQADTIWINLSTNDFGIINGISIRDNGVGISFDELSNKFKPFNDSEKADSIKKTNHTLPHGKRGIGRLTFFSFAQSARWNTVYKQGDSNYEYYISMEKDSLNQYDDNGGDSPHITDKETGTEVTFNQIYQLSKEEIVSGVKEEYFWFLELNRKKGFKIFIDDEALSYEEFVEKRETFEPDANLKHKYEISIVQWKQSLGKEYSKFYFIASNEEERYKEATKLNKKSDEFYHSIFIKSNYFDTFYFEKEDEGQTNLFPNRTELEYKTLINSIYGYLNKLRRNYLKKVSDKFIDRMIDSKLYPEFDSNSILDTYHKEELNNLIGTLYAAQPKIFTNLSDDNKKITIGLLNLIMKSEDKESLFSVLKELVEMDADELQELSNVLQYTSLSNIAKLVKLLEDRQQVIQGLKELVFNKGFNTKEVSHIQKVIENHYWIFGEQYNLITAAEPDFEQALRGLIKATTGEEEDLNIDHEDKNKEMDIYMIRQDRKGTVTENVVVELKRPTVSLGEKELSQVKKYMRVIRSNDRFNMGNVKWTFYLVGNKFNNSNYIEGELDSNSSHGENHLVYWVDGGKTKIYVLKWSEIFEEFSLRHNYLLEKLKLEESLWLKTHDNASDVVADVTNNSAMMDKPVVPKNKKNT